MSLSPTVLSAEMTLQDVSGITVSLVSHGHGNEVLDLVRSLAKLLNPSLAQVIVTLNVPEPELSRALSGAAWPFSLTVVENRRPAGFGANHNAAFALRKQSTFCVLNPDVGLLGDPFPALLTALGSHKGGCAYPLQVDEAGRVQETAREVPTLMSLLKRHLWPQPEHRRPIHWATGACLLFDANVYHQLRGFDEDYFMYCEDVDICIRLQLLGYQLVPSDAQIVHVATAASHRNFRHLAWHIRSLLRLWASSSYREFRRRSGVSG